MKVTIKDNIYGNWYGYIGGKKAESFFNTIPGYGMEQEAREWLKQNQCQAFLLCEQQATTEFDNPLVGVVRSCERCKAKLSPAAV